MSSPTIRRIEWARLPARRPRVAGSNARLGVHGDRFLLQLARVTDSDDIQGFGWAHLNPDAAQALIGRPVDEGFTLDRGATGPFAAIEYPLWDLAGRRANAPVYALLGGDGTRPLHVPTYDTSLYFDDLDLTDDDDAAARIAEEARQGLALGHRNFKIKVGRGARHLPPEQGMHRDAAVVRAVREAAGAEATIMADANNGFTLNLAKRFLADTAEARLHWLEEPFHEDPVLLDDLHQWLHAQGLDTRIADGEGLAAAPLMDWARRGSSTSCNTTCCTPASPAGWPSVRNWTPAASGPLPITTAAYTATTPRATWPPQSAASPSWSGTRPTARLWTRPVTPWRMAKSASRPARALASNWTPRRSPPPSPKPASWSNDPMDPCAPHHAALRRPCPTRVPPLLIEPPHVLWRAVRTGAVGAPLGIVAARDASPIPAGH
jgi:hypothetical protein